MMSRIVQAEEGIQLYTESFGQPSSAACICISGAMASARFWTEVFFKHLVAKGLLVIRYDQRDVGLSSGVDWETNPYTLAELASDALAIVDAYGVKEAYFVGHSMGGCVCQQLAIAQPRCMVGCTVIASPPIGGTPEIDMPLSAEEQAILEQTWALFLARKDADGEEGFITIWKHLNGTRAFDEAMARVYTVDILTRTNHPLRAGNNHERVMRLLYDTRSTKKGLLEQIRIPTLVIQGTHDPLVLPREGKALAHAISCAYLAEVPGMGHMLFNRELEGDISDMILAHMERSPSPLP